MMKTAPFFAAAVTVLMLSVPSLAHALEFTPTDVEWVAWPDYCRARYVESGAGRYSEFRSKISQAEVANQRSKLGAAWNWLHHFCAGVVYMARAESSPDEGRAEFWRLEAERNLKGYLERVDQMQPMFVQSNVRLAQLYRQKGNDEEAMQLLESAIVVRPDAAALYGALAIFHRDSGNFQKAIEVLEQGNRFVKGQSAEIHYFLGLIYLEVDEIDLAVEHAGLAYNLGYPLPGLATKLENLGRPLHERTQ